MQACLNMQCSYPTRESVDTQTAATLMGCSWPQVKQLIKEGTLQADYTRGTRSHGGITYRIPVSALPPEAQVRWRAMQSGKATNVDLTTYKERKAQAAVDRLQLSRRARAEEKRIREEAGRAVMNELQTKVNAMEELALLAGRRGGVLEAKQAIADRLGIRLRQLYEYQKAYEAEGWAGLMDKTERADKGRPRTMCLMAQDYIAAEYCTTGKARQNVICDNLQRLAEGLGCSACDICPHNPGSLCRAEMIVRGEIDPYDACSQAGNGIIAPANRHAVNRYIETIPQAVKAAGRRGWAYWEAKFMPKVKREKPERVNEVWFGDHHVFDLFVEYEGKPVRPWLTALMDAKSSALVGWAICLTPNSDTIVESMATAIAKTHGSPFCGMTEMLYIDNGKDYRCRRIEGDGKRLQLEEIGKLNLDFTGDNALLKSLGIGVTHAIPYRAWSKPIERIFGIIETRWIRGLPGYCENDIEERPEQLNKDIRDHKLLSYQDFVALWANKIWPEYNSFKAEGAEASPLEIYQNSEKARQDVPSWSTLAIAKSLRKDRKVTTTGVSLGKKTYQHPALAAHVGSWVTVLYSRQDIGSVTILRDGQFVCEAADTSINPYKMVGEDPERLAEHMRNQQAARKGVRDALRLPMQRVKFLGAMACEIPDVTTNGNITSFVHERAYRGQQEGKERIKEQQEAKAAASTAAGSKIRSKWAAEGERLLQGGAK
jgi:putative transposase